MFLVALATTGFGCNEAPTLTEAPTMTEAPKTLTARNVLFTLNTQEFIFVEESVATVNRVLDIHEAYDVPVDIYLDDPILQTYLTEAPELIERLKTSPVVTVSYHSRPPIPYYYEYDWLGLNNYSEEEVIALIEDYGTHTINMETGETTDQPGGFTYFEEVFGYAPVAAATPTSPTVAPHLKDYFVAHGARFLVENGRDYGWGETKDGIPVRPEDVEVKLFERTDESPETIFGELDELAGSGPYFINIKVHDNDFIADESAWIAIYLKNKRLHGGTLTPPFDLTLGEDRTLLNETESETLWAAYEACVKYVSDHPTIYTAWNMKELADQL